MSYQSAPTYCWILLTASALVGSAAAADDTEFFESRIRPVFAAQCWDCHSVDNAESDLRLDDRNAMLQGGTRGPALVPGQPEQSLLVHAIRHSERLQMPPKAKLEARQIADIAQWIKSGAPWPNHDPSSAQSEQPSVDYELTDDDRNFWAFKSPVKRPLPAVRRQAWIQSPIDQFVLAGLEKHNLRPAAAADKRTLIRRATFDLIGLPPTPDEVEAFLADSKPGAFERVVDRLLASPRYGERWGRHWLDVARYADSNGLDENLAFANAYRYRDYVIRAFNGDKPFDRFVREQIAGDLLEESDTSDPFDRIIATGFLSLGAKMLAEDDPVKMQMDIIDEQVDTIGRALMGLTLGCARCHDHKFDPIPITDYYSIAGILKSTKTMDHFNVVAKWQERELATDEYVQRRQDHDKKVAQQQSRIDEQVALADQLTIELAKQHVGDYLLAAGRFASIRRQLDIATPQGDHPATLPPGHHLLEAEDFVRGNVRKDADSYGKGIGVLVNQGKQPNQVEYELECDTAAWYQLEIRYAALESRPCDLSVNGRSFERPVAAETTGGWQPESQSWHVDAIVRLQAGRNVLRLEQPNAFPHIDKLRLVPLEGDVVVEVAPISNDYQVVPSFVSQWHQYLTEHSDQSPVLRTWNQRPANAADVRALALAYQNSVATLLNQAADDDDQRQAELRQLLDDPHGPFALPGSLERYHTDPLSKSVNQAREQLKALKKQAPPIPAAMGVTEADPENLRVHLRGSHLTLGQEVPRRLLRVIPSAGEFEIPSKQSGRLQLAAWLTDRAHPLTARVIVNRLWQWHFGAGLVPSPDNFGRLGQRPSHPELLDWLALRMMDSGWSIKAMHRLLMNSSTYQMSSEPSMLTDELDPENRYLSHFNRRRLEAEAVRDSVLAVSGTLELSMGGTRLTTANRAYVTSTANVSPKVYQSRHRSVYLPVVRSALYEVMQSFDFPDPSVTTGKRQTTTVAPQALFMMNSELVSNQAMQLARQLLGDRRLDDRQRIEHAYLLVYSRTPDDDEVDMALRYVQRYLAGLSSQELNLAAPEERAWQSLCRALMSANEFIYVE